MNQSNKLLEMTSPVNQLHLFFRRLTGIAAWESLFELRNGQNASEFTDANFRSIAVMAIGAIWQIQQYTAFDFSTPYARVVSTLILSATTSISKLFFFFVLDRVYFGGIQQCRATTLERNDTNLSTICLVCHIGELCDSPIYPLDNDDEGCGQGDTHRLWLYAVNCHWIPCGQPPSITPKVYRMRRILLVWTLFCVCWIAAYSSSLISMITRPMHVITVMLQIIIIGNNFNSGVYAIHVG